jgi:prophage maintenance system killer protein
MSDNDRKLFISSILDTLITLENFDRGELKLKTKKKELTELKLEEAIEVINDARIGLIQRGEEVKFFGVDNTSGLQKVIKTIYATFDDQDLYPNFEDKAANLLYLIIKDHPFVDGNKRIGTVLFDYYTMINNNRVTIIPSFPLLIAQSNPKEKELMINLIITQIQAKNNSH